MPQLQEMERDTMSDKGNKQDKSTWAIGGGVLLGLGIGFFFLPQSALFFIGSLISGIGVGLIVTAILSTFNR